MIFLTRNVIKLINVKTTHCSEIRCYSRWTHRRPRRVLTTEEFQNTDTIPEHKRTTANSKSDFVLQSTKSKWIPKQVETSLGLINMNEVDRIDASENPPKAVKRKRQKYKTKSSSTEETTDMLETVIDANGELVYTKLKDNDAAVSQLLLTVKSRRQQIKQDLALLEGKRLIKDALEANCTLKHLIFSRISDVEFLKPYLPSTGAKLLKMPYREIQMWSDLTTTPGVMGIFKTPEVENFIPQSSFPITIICDNIREPGNLGAILRTVAGVGVDSVILTKGCVDLWDTKVLRSACGAHFCLQIYKKMDWSAIRQRLLSSNSALFLADNKIVTETEVDEGNVEQQSLKDILVGMPLLPYYGVQFSDYNSFTLVIGGETQGISEESFRLAAELNGIRLNIPLNNNVDSLNAGTALGIILFEIKRQLTMSKNQVKKALAE